MSNLAESYRVVGRTQEALDLIQQALEMKERVLGIEHPGFLHSIRYQLAILRDLGRTEQLLDLLRVALPMHDKVLGVDHPDMVWLREAFRKEISLL
jgi:hypothetical protein